MYDYHFMPTLCIIQDDVTLDYAETTVPTISVEIEQVFSYDHGSKVFHQELFVHKKVLRTTQQPNSLAETATEVFTAVNILLEKSRNETDQTTLTPSQDESSEDSTAPYFKKSEEFTINAEIATEKNDAPEEISEISDVLNEQTEESGPSAELFRLAESVEAIKATTTDIPTEDVIAEETPMKILPPPVKIYDPSVDVEATTFLAEANLATEPDYGVTIEYFGDDVTEVDSQLLVTTEEPDSTAKVEDEFESRSGDEVIVSRRRPRPSPIAWANKKRSYSGYKVLRVVLPTEESVNRILALEDEEGIDFWADPRLLLRPRGLFVMSATDMLVAPNKVEHVESILREARLTYTALVDDVQVVMQL